MPALIMVTWKLPTPGTSRVSTRLPVGKTASPASMGLTNSTGTSAAGKVTPSSSKAPVSWTSPLVIGTRLTMVLPMFFCQTRTAQTPFSGMRSGSTRPLLTAKAPTAALRFPQLPDQSTKALSMDTWPKR